MLQSFVSYHRRFLTRGFSTIDILVSMTIFVVMVAVLLASHRRFQSSILITNITYEMALAVREAQVFSLGARALGGDFDTGYGVHFDRTTPTRFFIFADTNDNLAYDVGIDQTIDEFTLTEGNRITAVCASNGSQSNCSTSSGSQQIGTLDVVFKRPDPDARLVVSGCGTCFTPFASAHVEITSPQGRVRRILVTNTGQISVQ